MDTTVQIASYHLVRMHNVGLLDRQQSGRFTFYSVNEDARKELKEFFE